jgi:hypothetical protein
LLPTYLMSYIKVRKNVNMLLNPSSLVRRT